MNEPDIPHWSGPERRLDPEFRRLREQHERELDEHYPHWLSQRPAHFSEAFEAWRQQRQGGRYDPGKATAPR